MHIWYVIKTASIYKNNRSPKTQYHQGMNVVLCHMTTLIDCNGVHDLGVIFEREWIQKKIWVGLEKRRIWIFFNIEREGSTWSKGFRSVHDSKSCLLWSQYQLSFSPGGVQDTPSTPPPPEIRLTPSVDTPYYHMGQSDKSLFGILHLLTNFNWGYTSCKCDD